MFANLRNGWFRNLVYQLFGGESRAARRRRKRAASRRAMAQCRQPMLEPLESRLLLTTFTVTDASNTVGSVSDVTLRYAVAHAQNGDQIGFSNSLSGDTITLSSTLTISKNVGITGLGAQNLTINGNNAVGVFAVTSGVTASISGLTITNGSARTGSGISNAGTLSLSNDTISGNGTISNMFNTAGAGVFNSGIMTISGCAVTGNTTYFNGGGIYNTGTMTLTNSTVAGNAAYTYGGGIYNTGAMTLSNDTVSGNFGWENIGSYPQSGGGIYSSGTLQMSNTIVSGNITSGTGQDIYGAVAAGSNNNLVGNSSGMTGVSNGTNGNIVGQGPATLGMLANNGGPTQTLSQTTGLGIGAGGAVTTLAPAGIVSTVATTFTVTNAAAIAVTNGDYLITVDSEQMLVTGVNTSTNVLTVTRGYNGTTAATHSAGAGVYFSVDQRGDAYSGTPDIGAYQDNGTAAGTPTVTGVSPLIGKPSGGTSVTITGTNLGNATAVDFGGLPGTIVSDSPTQIVVTAPAQSVGTVDVTVTTVGYLTSAIVPADQYTYGPTVSVTATSPLGLGTTTTGTAGTAQTFTVSGDSLTNNVTVTSPSGVEVSLDGTTYSNSVTITASGTLGSTTVYARITATAFAGSITGNIAVASIGATTQDVAVSGTVNSSLVVSGIGGTTTDTTPPTPITIAPNLVITDILNISSATVSFTSWQAGDRIQFSNTYALQHTFVENDTTNTATLTLTGIASAADYQATLQSVQFYALAAVLNTSTRVATFSVTDIYSNTSPAATQNITFSLTDVSSPVISGIGGTTTDTTPLTPVTIAPNLVITDSVGLMSATVSFTNWQVGDRLQFSNTYALQHKFVENDGANTATLTMTGFGSAAEYQATLQSVQFYAVAADLNTSTRVATFSVTDIYSNSSPAATQNISFNLTGASSPVISGIGGTTTDTAPPTPITIAPNLVITDSVNLLSATVSFTNWQAGDHVQFSNIDALQQTFVENDGANTATLTFAGFNSTAAYQATLQSVQFYAVAADLNTSTRVATFSVTDIYSNTSPVATQNISFNLTGASSPVISGIGGTTTDTTPPTPVTIAPNLVITDSVGLLSATVSFTNWQAGDHVQFSNIDALQQTFVENDGANTATLTLTGFGSVAAYQATLRSVQFDATAADLNASTRVATFSVTDIYSNTSPAATQNISFNLTGASSPVISGIGGTTTDTTPPTPTTIAPNLVITDSVGLLSATVSFTNWQAGDRLQFSNTYALQHTFVENDGANTAALTLTGFGSVAAYQATLQSVQFYAVAANLNTSMRVATFSVTDIYSNTSPAATQNISFNLTGATSPVISGIGGTTTDTAPPTPVTIAPNLVITDSVSLLSATVSFTNWQAGDHIQFSNTYALQHTFVENDGANTATLSLTGFGSTAAYQATLHSVQFYAVAADLNISTRVATFSVTDIYSNTSPAATQNISFNLAGASSPTITGIGGTTTDTAPPTPITIAPNLVVTDSVSLLSATVSFTNWQAGDRVQFSNTYALQHSFVENDTANTATLTLTGFGSVAAYQATLQTVQFYAVAADLNTSTRVATFSVTDIYGNTSPAATQNISFNLIGASSPVISGIGGTTNDTTPPTPVTIAPNLVITDSVGLSSATVSFTNWQAGDRVQFSNTYALQHTFVENDTANTATLSLTGFGSVAAYQATLQSVQFYVVAADLNTSTRVATFSMTDIYGNTSLASTQNIHFSLAGSSSPVISGIGGTTTDTTPPTPISIAPNLVITDSVGLSSATVSFTNLQAGDRIQFSNMYALQHTFVQNELTGTATLTLTGFSSAAAYQATLQSVQFYALAGNPNTSTRVATFSVTDIYSNSTSGTQNVSLVTS